MCLAAATLVSNAAPSIAAMDSKVRMSVTQLLTEDFSGFVEQYNEYHEADLLATKLLRYRPLILEDNGKGYFFDFDYGYMVATEDYDIRQISNYDLSFENELFLTDESIYFTGTAFFDSCGKEYGVVNDDIPSTGSSEAGNNYASNVSSFDKEGGITSATIKEYLSTFYSGYSIVQENYVDFYDYIFQADTSVYLQDAEGGPYSEGNCVINSTFSMLHNMGIKGRDFDFDYLDKYVDYSGEKLKNDPHYSIRNNVGGWRPNDGYNWCNPNQGKKRLTCMSDLYLHLREKAITSYGYDEDRGMGFSCSKDMAMEAAKSYGYETKFFQTNDFDSMRQSINCCIPALVSATNSITYRGSHAMAVNGYIKLEKQTKWWFFTGTDTKWILAVDDGHQDSCIAGREGKRRFYDPNRQGGASFVCVDTKTVVYSYC
jgi:hypothetical protein